MRLGGFVRIIFNSN